MGKMLTKSELFWLWANLPRLARAKVLCKPWPEPNLRAVDNFHG